MNLEKKCINKTFPQIVVVEEDKCPNPSCKGDDKFCPQYVATDSFKLHEIEQTLDNQDATRAQNPQKGGITNGKYTS